VLVNFRKISGSKHVITKHQTLNFIGKLLHTSETFFIPDVSSSRFTIMSAHQKFCKSCSCSFRQDENENLTTIGSGSVASICKATVLRDGGKIDIFSLGGPWGGGGGGRNK
jgi:hypothetical protein